MRPFPGDKARPSRRASLPEEQSPYEAPPVEGMPYEDGTLEDRAIREILAEGSKPKA